MATQWTVEYLVRHFGPKLIHAIILLIIEHFNILRKREGLTEFTPAQVVQAIGEKYEAIPDYPWMGEG